ncbi:hypothetical protein SAMN04487891_10651 [Flagellimonas taeanensis]|uniref:Uncharacterized protein n=1 Tax=Flagellimonas taeanensis TaxID=1005926 RepID=A0A1M6Z4Q8_9FLAO|nr:hypothetical protein [Allomuricauda taeanensis]SFC11751.1 hypothetical protein SAMN04487891_10651 [Allomuricauda taeanensis]SHL25373.1 hypothetical protein SAMN05216293_3069 [Allomuricauda taeanensis]
MLKKRILSFTFTLMVLFVVKAQETYPANVLGGPLIGMDLYNFSSREITGKVPHLHSLEVSFGLADWYWTSNTSVAGATTSINLQMEGDFTSFTMVLPSGGHKKVTLAEANIHPTGYSIADIQLDIEFGKISARAHAEMDFHGKWGERKHGAGGMRFNSRNDEDAFNKYVDDFFKQNKRYPSVSELFSSLDGKISIKSRGTFNTSILSDEAAFMLNRIREYVEKEWAEIEKNNKLNNLLADAQNAEHFGRIDEAIQKYEEHYGISKDPSIKAKIDELKAKKQAEAEAAKAKTDSLVGTETGTEENGTKEAQSGRNQEVVDNFDHTIPKQQLTTELDFWGNPIVSKTDDGEAKTVSYAGMEVENTEQYRQQMELRQNNTYAREQFQLQEAEKKQQIDNNNNAIYQQGNDIYQNSLNIESDFEQAKSQLDYGSGDALLKSSAALAGAATNAADATTGLAGMGVGLLLKMGENAAKRKAAEEARAERERQRKAEEARIKAAKEALKNTRLKVFKAFPEGELPLSSTKSSGDNLYYFVYSYNESQLAEQNPTVTTIPVFAIGKYPDGTWPLQTKIATELNTLDPSQKTICGPFYSAQEAAEVFNSFSKLLTQTQMQLKPIEYKGFNAHPENGPSRQTKAKLDFWGNPVKN